MSGGHGILEEISQYLVSALLMAPVEVTTCAHILIRSMIKTNLSS